MNGTSAMMRKLREAAALHQAGQLADAQHKYEGILRIHPHHGEALR